ncbi:histidine kinase [Novosphingobium barchaimii LL02]|uniref:Histidine kinase n=1 Tax=Novosphingobium barchaimii LL02 TaxID=1114963 RepID=A0A0J7XHI4_9SPHN|nr:response regulator [Novosphingobium barchaimii]KMS51114.1 histidine kinase [Novosphingobium barchaimii LL02]
MQSKQALVLLIDDVREIVEELLTFMELHGIPAVGVSDLDEAIAALEGNPAIRVLACDVRLGRESGLTIVSRIRNHTVLCQRPFNYMFITGDPLLQDPTLQMPDHMVLTKPVQPQILIDVLRDMLGELENSTQQGDG